LFYFPARQSPFTETHFLHLPESYNTEQSPRASKELCFNLAVINFYVHNIPKSSSSKGSSHLTKWKKNMAGTKQVADYLNLIHQKACHYHGRLHGTKSSQRK
jgi:hypothetical protein